MKHCLMQGNEFNWYLLMHLQFIKNKISFFRYFLKYCSMLKVTQRRRVKESKENLIFHTGLTPTPCVQFFEFLPSYTAM